MLRAIGCVAVLLLSVSSAHAIKVPPGMDHCPSLQACMKLLETVVHTSDPESFLHFSPCWKILKKLQRQLLSSTK